MDASPFDGLVRHLADVASRRRALVTLAATLLGSAALASGQRRGTAVAQDGGPLATPVSEPPAPAAAPGPCTQFVLSGGPSPGDPIHVDDDLTVSLNGEPIFVDRDGTLNVFAPLHFQAMPGDQLTVVARDAATCGRKIGALWLHCATGGEARFLTGGQDLGCDPDRNVPENFFRESWQI